MRDQQGCPTYAPDIAAALLALIENSREWSGTPKLHFANKGAASWADFASAIFEEAARRGLPAATVEPITTAEYPTPAQRPHQSALDTGLISERFQIVPRHWSAALADFFDARSKLFTPR